MFVLHLMVRVVCVCMAYGDCCVLASECVVFCELATGWCGGRCVVCLFCAVDVEFGRCLVVVICALDRYALTPVFCVVGQLGCGSGGSDMACGTRVMPGWCVVAVGSVWCWC